MNNDIKTIKQFDKWSKTYDHGIWKKYFDAGYTKVLRAVKIKDGSTILDLGCGTGDLAYKINKYSKKSKIIGLDLSEAMLDVAKFKRGKEDKNIIFQKGNSESLPFQDDYFDYIFCLNSFHHYANYKKALQEIHRVLKNDGFFILLDPITDNPIRKLWSFILKIVFNEWNINYFSCKNIQEMFFAADLMILKQESFQYFTLLTLAKNTK